MRTIDLIVMHCSAGKYGTAESIRAFHMAPVDADPPGRGWRDIGYNYVIRNGWTQGRAGVRGRFSVADAGMVELGRDLDHDGNVDEEVGSHAVHFNRNSIGVCLVGPPFHDDQVNAAVELVSRLCSEYHLDPATQIKGHRELPNVAKECPVIDMERFRSAVKLHAQT